MDSQKSKIIKHLWDMKWHPVYEFIQDLYIMQYNVRIKELRDLGFKIVNKRYSELSQHDKEAVCRRLLKQPKDSLTFLRLVTPTNCIDFNTLTIKPIEKQNNSQKELFTA